MNDIEMLKKLEVPKHPVDVVLDTDTYNEVDDQFALVYLLKSTEKLNCKAIYAAPFKKGKLTPREGMEKSYDEILNILRLSEREDMIPFVFKGSEQYLPNEETPVKSKAAEDLVKRANQYSNDNPLYVVAIGAITNIASAILMDPSMIDKIVVIWLGGHALHWGHNREFNMMQDVAAARVVMGSGVPLVLLPCNGVVSEFTVSVQELEHWLRGVNRVCDYLVDIVANYDKSYQKGKPWCKQIWDVTAVAWLLNEDNRFMSERLIHAPIPQYDHHYSLSEDTHFIKYIWNIHRNELFADLFEKLRKKEA